jgi:hypothetical protein
MATRRRGSDISASNTAFCSPGGRAPGGRKSRPKVHRARIGINRGSSDQLEGAWKSEVVPGRKRCEEQRRSPYAILRGVQMKKLKRIAYKKEPILKVHRYIVTVGKHSRSDGAWRTKFHYCVNLKEVQAVAKSAPSGAVVEVHRARHDFINGFQVVK